MFRKTFVSASFLVVLLLVFLGAGAPLLAQTPALGPELQINSYTTGDQAAKSFKTVAMDSAGNFVVVWTSYGEDGSDDGVFARRFDHSGLPLGGELQVNTYTTGKQREAAIAMDPAGDFVVVWSSYYELGAGIVDVFGQRYDPAGAAQGGEFHVNTYTGKARHPSIGMDASGNFVVAWQSNSEDGSGLGVFAQRYDSGGTRLGGEFQVNTYTTGDQGGPDVGMNATGDFVIAWGSQDQDGSGLGVFAQRYDASGAAQGSELQVNTYTTDDQGPSGVGMDAAGNFVVVWTSRFQDGSGLGAFGRSFDAAGAPRGGEFQINTYTTGDQAVPIVAMNASGEFTVVWESNFQDGSELGSFGQRFDAAGRRLGAAFPVNTYTTGIQTAANVAMNDSGNFVIAWDSQGQDGDGYGTFARRGEFHAAQPMKVDVHQGTGTSSNMNGVLEPGETVQVEPAWMDTVAVPQTFTATASNLTGPPGPTYAIDVSDADYGTVAPGATTDCYDATPEHQCYVVTVSGARPAQHWDATFDETLTTGFTVGPSLGKTWTLHVGESFPDVPQTQQFYAFIENLFHNGITGGCGGGDYCPDSSVTRGQMAVFLLKAAHGTGFVPPACAGIFPDVPCPSQFADWIEELSHEGITGGCGGGDYCPTDPVTRAQMAVFLLKSEHGSSYAPPSCTGVFPDVPCPSLFADWIEALSSEGITGGCGGGNYCPTSPNTRGQMAVFLVKTFGLLLYGP